MGPASLRQKAEAKYGLVEMRLDDGCEKKLVMHQQVSLPSPR